MAALLKPLLLAGTRKGIHTLGLWVCNRVQGVGTSPDLISGQGSQALSVHKVTLNVLLCSTSPVGDCCFCSSLTCAAIWCCVHRLHALFLGRHCCCRLLVCPGCLGECVCPLMAALPCKASCFCHRVSPCAVPHCNCWCRSSAACWDCRSSPR